MSEVTTLPAPELFSAGPFEGAWGRERLAFHAALPSLLSTHLGLYVAVHDGRVIAEGPDKLDVARRAYESAGYVPVYVGLITDRPEPPVRMPSPRTSRPTGAAAP